MGQGDLGRRSRTTTVWLLIGVVLLAIVTGFAGKAALSEIRGSAVPTEFCPADEITRAALPRAQYVADRLGRAGYPADAVAGVLGSLDALSALTPTAQRTSGRGTGLALWEPERWDRYAASTAPKAVNRWSLDAQTTFLLEDMAADPDSFSHDRLKRMSDPVEAAVYFHERYVRSSTAPREIRATSGVKARGWARELSGAPSAVTTKDDDTYGLVLTCEPPGATLERCPAVPRAFRASFRQHTGFRWGSISEGSQLVSRCVYANFPDIRLHGTYEPGHLPSWDRALDFMMPSGCTTAEGRSFTRSQADARMGDRLAQYLLRRGERFDLDYVIWQDRISMFSPVLARVPFSPDQIWREDGNNNGDCTNTHFDHVHMSLTPAA